MIGLDFNFNFGFDLSISGKTKLRLLKLLAGGVTVTSHLLEEDPDYGRVVAAVVGTGLSINRTKETDDVDFYEVANAACETFVHINFADISFRFLREASRLR